MSGTRTVLVVESEVGVVGVLSDRANLEHLLRIYFDEEEAEALGDYMAHPELSTCLFEWGSVEIDGNQWVIRSGRCTLHSDELETVWQTGMVTEYEVDPT